MIGENPAHEVALKLELAGRAGDVDSAPELLEKVRDETERLLADLTEYATE